VGGGESPARVGLPHRVQAIVATGNARFDRLDAVRAVAIVWMVVFHIGFDLHHFDLLEPGPTGDPLRRMQRVCIVSLFLLCAGIGQAVALEHRQSWSRFWHRWAQIAGCALLVSAGSAWMFPRSWIHFGVLHGIAVMLVASRLAAPLRAWLWPLGAVTILLPRVVQLPFFDHAALDWIGLVTHKPRTQDYVPVLPWLGIMLWGLASGQWLLQHRPALLTAPLPEALRLLAALGRRSLSVYMLHQPLLIGAIMGGRALQWW